MLDPTTFPRARLGKPSNADLTLTINSGADVAKETTVMPITILGMLNLKDNPTAAFKSQFPPKIKKTKPNIIYKKSMYLFLREDNTIPFF